MGALGRSCSSDWVLGTGSDGPVLTTLLESRWDEGGLQSSHPGTLDRDGFSLVSKMDPEHS